MHICSTDSLTISVKHDTSFQRLSSSFFLFFDRFSHLNLDKLVRTHTRLLPDKIGLFPKSLATFLSAFPEDVCGFPEMNLHLLDLLVHHQPAEPGPAAHLLTPFVLLWPCVMNLHMWLNLRSDLCFSTLPHSPAGCCNCNLLFCE